MSRVRLALRFAIGGTRSMQTRHFRNPLDSIVAMAAFSAIFLSASGAEAVVTISSAATANMSCASGVCTPTAKTAVLNVSDLQNFLASGNVTVTTTGTGVEASDIHVSAALTWSNFNTLSLAAHRSISINAHVLVAGLSGLTLDSGRKDALSFRRKGHISFKNTRSSLNIDGTDYTLVGDIKTLASNIAHKASGKFALANNYDASADGWYATSPISTVFKGTFEGLGNAISNLSVDGGTKVKVGYYEGFFAEISSRGKIRDLGLLNVNMSVPGNNFDGASLVGLSFGSVKSCYSTGVVAVQAGQAAGAGGLVGNSYGAITNSYSTASVEANLDIAGGLVAVGSGAITGSYATGPVSASVAGGLVGGEAGGSITTSYATGPVSVTSATFMTGGGLVGGLEDLEQASAAISNSYATGSVNGPAGSDVGGLLGINDSANSTVNSSYSTGAVTGGAQSNVGGLIGVDDAQLNTDTYWDTDTSGITNLSQGAGNVANDPGITGLTTAQFQSGLPAGFDPAVWAENASINGGLPYLRANKPPGHR